MRADLFIEWLRNQGAQVLPCTNPYEIARFIAHGKTHVVYENQRGRIRAMGFGAQCVEMFEQGGRLAMGYARKASRPLWKKKQAVIERDGPWCFFCHRELTFEEATLEHLVAKVRGGPDHLDNLALACENCNSGIDNMTLMDKIRIREANLDKRSPEAVVAANTARTRIASTSRVGVRPQQYDSHRGMASRPPVGPSGVRRPPTVDGIVEKVVDRKEGEGVSR